MLPLADAVSIPPWFWGLAALSACLIVLPRLDRENRRHRLLVASAGIVAITLYMGWRVLCTLDLSDLANTVFSIVFLVLELLSVAGSVIVLAVLTKLRDRRPDVARGLPWLRATRPQIAIFVATYNEGERIIDRTLTGALGQTYPCKVCLLDDGRRPEMQALAQRRGVTWLTRADNAHAKAGNMNAAWALLKARGERPDFVAILDADFVALPDFVERSAALFMDPRIGVVQTPQTFFNPDPLQHRIKAPFDLPDEQRFFFDTILPAKDGWETAQSCGTSSLVRADALDAVGGFPVESVTEDMLLSLRLKRKGYITAYLHERLSLGLAPEGIGEFCTQRVRWCVGAMQIARGPDGILGRNGLALRDRMSLAETVLYWAGSFPFRMACMIVPILYWTTGLSPMSASVEDLAAWLLPRMVVETAAVGWFSTGRIVPLLTDASQLLIAPEIVAASYHTLFFPGERPFKVTPKGADRSGTTVHWHIFWRFAGVMGLTLAGLVASYWSPLSPTFFFENKGVVAFWSVYNMLVCAIGILVCIETPRRAEERVEMREIATFRFTDGRRLPVRLVDISASGVAFANLGDFVPGDEGTVDLPGIGPAPARIMRITDTVVGARIDLSAEQLVELTKLQFSERKIRNPRIGLASGLAALARGLAGG